MNSLDALKMKIRIYERNSLAPTKRGTRSGADGEADGNTAQEVLRGLRYRAA